MITGEKELVGDIQIDLNVQLAKMNVFQVLGSGISYFRRYQILAALGLAQEDDDGGGAKQQEVKPLKAPIIEVDVPVLIDELTILYNSKADKVKEEYKAKITKTLDSGTVEDLVKRKKYLKEL